MGDKSAIAVELDNPEAVLLAEIPDKRICAQSIALTYAFGLRQGGVDWARVNRAIIEYRSRSALERIKNLAWKQLRQYPQEERG